MAAAHRKMIDAAANGILRLDRAGSIVDANPAALRLLGYSREEAQGLPVGALTASAELVGEDTQRVRGEIFSRKDGSGVPVDFTSAPLRRRGHLTGSVVIFDDVSEPRRLQEQLLLQATHDSLTGLLNRRRLEEEMAEQLRQAKRYGRAGALLLMDLDSFKFVNDSFGHPAGDELLRSVAAALRDGVRETDVVARLGGDEFAVLLRETDEAGAVKAARGLIAAIRSRSTPSVGASAGIAIFEGADESAPDDLLVAADIALYEAKENRGSVVVHAGRPGQGLTWVERIRTALAEERLAVYAQPIIALHSGEVVREELLVRLLDPDGMRIPPASFLPAAERFGLVQEIDLHVLRRGIELARRGKSVAVNLSGRTLEDPRIAAAVEAAIAAGVEPARLSFEITETAAVAKLDDAHDFAERIRGLGCTLGLDNFGSGFSSFAYLKHIPVDYLKIDRQFVRELEGDRADQRLIEAIVDIADIAGRQTVAEGVESAVTLALLSRLGVDCAQGNFIGRPEPIEFVASRPQWRPTQPSPMR